MSDQVAPPIPSFWDSLIDKRTGKKLYETREEQDPFRMPIEEFEKLRFRMSNMTLRLVECYNHPQGLVFGFRLHPPHLWDIREGVLYKKVNKQWVKFIPDYNENTKRESSR